MLYKVYTVGSLHPISCLELLGDTSTMLTYSGSGVVHKTWITWDHNKQQHKEGSVREGAVRGVDPPPFHPPVSAV